MTKKKGIASKLFIGLTGLTLLSCCFLGTTFARYTSGGSGTAEVGVALWSVDFLDEADGDEISTSTPVALGDISPDMEAWTDTAVPFRSHTTEAVLVGVVKNEGEVSAKVTLAVTDPEENKYTFNGSADFGSEGEFIDTNDYTGNPTQTIVDGLFTYTLTYTFGEQVNQAYTGQEITIAPTKSVSFYMSITWTSADNMGQEYSDALDTWVGINIATINYDLTFTAVQASERPPEAGD